MFSNQISLTNFNQSHVFKSNLAKQNYSGKWKTEIVLNLATKAKYRLSIFTEYRSDRTRFKSVSRCTLFTNHFSSLLE